MQIVNDVDTVVANNTAVRISVDSDSSATVENNVVIHTDNPDYPDYSTGGLYLMGSHGSIVENNTADYVYAWNNEDTVVRSNIAMRIAVGSDTNALFEDNVITADRHGGDATAAKIFSRSDSDVNVVSNTAGYLSVYKVIDSKIINNDASSDYFSSDSGLDVESNEGEDLPLPRMSATLLQVHTTD